MNSLSHYDVVKKPGPEDQALVCPWKGVLVIAGVEALNPGVGSQESA